MRAEETFSRNSQYSIFPTCGSSIFNVSNPGCNEDGVLGYFHDFVKLP